MNRKQRRREAFTLLELMIVLVILVLLFAMVGPRLLGFAEESGHQGGAGSRSGIWKSALRLYDVDMRSFPSTEDGLQALLEPPSDERAARKWDGPYLDDDVLPLDPWDNHYEYEYPPTNNKTRFPRHLVAGARRRSRYGRRYRQLATK